MSWDCTRVAFSLFVGVAGGQMEKVAASAFLEAAEWRVDESRCRVTEAQQKCHLTLPTWTWPKPFHFTSVDFDLFVYYFIVYLILLMTLGWLVFVTHTECISPSASRHNKTCIAAHTFVKGEIFLYSSNWDFIGTLSKDFACQSILTFQPRTHIGGLLTMRWGC